MNAKNNENKNLSRKAVIILGVVCWITYFSIYLGRLNFSASMSEILQNSSWNKAELGSVAAVFYLAYGLGQFPSGLLGDRLSAKILVLTGLVGATVTNGVFPFMESVSGLRVIWFINGFAQALIWPPMARLITDMVQGKQAVTIMLLMSFTSPIGMLCAYLLSAITMLYGDWRYCFWVVMIWLAAVALFWYMMISKLEKGSTQVEQSKTTVIKRCLLERNKENSKQISLAATGMIWILGATFIQGVLKDGLNTWIPTYLTEKFSIAPTLSVVLTMILPVINLSGVYIAETGNKLVFKNEAATAAVSFALTLFSLWGMIFTSEKFLYGTVALFAVVTSMMIAVNTLFISLLPMHFKKEGKVATVSGLLNAVTYVGSAAASAFFGYVAERAGWNGTQIAWCFCAATGMVLCLLAVKKWGKNRENIYGDS